MADFLTSAIIHGDGAEILKEMNSVAHDEVMGQ